MSQSSTIAISPYPGRVRDRVGDSPLGAKARRANATGSDPTAKAGAATITTGTTTTTTTNAAGIGGGELEESPAVEQLRLWRHDALMQHKLRTAEFVADKVFHMTGNANDAFWLAQVYFAQGSYVRVVDLLQRRQLDVASVVCRYLTGLALLRLERLDDALDCVGETNPFAGDRDPGDSGGGVAPTTVAAAPADDGGIRIESSLCYVRGKIYLAQNNFEKARLALQEALLVDVKNVEALLELLDRKLLTPSQELALLKSLDFSQLAENDDMVKSLYQLRLSKHSVANLDTVHCAKRNLDANYHFQNNIDAVACDIDLYYTSCQFNRCLDACENVLVAENEFDTRILPTYISCLHELHCKTKLFQLSHKLAEHFPKSPITWFSVGTYYLTINKIAEARKYFSKSSILDPSFIPAWLGFSHTFGLEGEHDQAISAYSTAARFFPGMHLPNLFLGMQYMALNTLSLADEYFTLAYDICPNDPLLLNEMGVLHFKKNDLQKAKRYFKKALDAVTGLDSTSKTAVSIKINLAHIYRRLGEIEMAIKCFKAILEVSGKDADIFCSLGFLFLKSKQLQKAIDHLHVSLAMRPSNQVAQDLLNHALELNVSMSLDADHPIMVSARLQADSKLATALSTRKRHPASLRNSSLPKRVRRIDNDLMETE